MSLDYTGRLDDETVRIVEAVLMEGYPPTNPSVLLKALRNWYLAHGRDEVFLAFMDWFAQLFHYDQKADSIKYYQDGQKAFLAKTGREPKAVA